MHSDPNSPLEGCGHKYIDAAVSELSGRTARRLSVSLTFRIWLHIIHTQENSPHSQTQMAKRKIFCHKNTFSLAENNNSLCGVPILGSLRKNALGQKSTQSESFFFFVVFFSWVTGDLESDALFFQKRLKKASV